MEPSQAESVLFSWSFEPIPAVGSILAAWLYFLGWKKLTRLLPERFPSWRLLSFFSGLLVIYVAIASPLDAFASWLLSVHMVQHLLLTMVAAPLLLLGAPFLPLLSGLPRGFAREGLAPFLNDPKLKKIGSILVRPLFAGPLFMVSNVLWHLPVFYETALGSSAWHEVEHACFLATALLFWWPVVQPWPSRPAWPRWAMVPYLLLVDIQNTALSGFFNFSERVLYPTYAVAPRITALSALEDQSAAGGIMWVPGSIVFLLPAAFIAIKCLSPKLHRPSSVPPLRHRPAPSSPSVPFDLFDVPLIGRLLRWRYFRVSMQVLLFALAIVIVADGFFGPQVAAMNLAGVLPWTHWRGFTVIALLVVGNFFCMACPFTFARNLVRRIFPPSRHWPVALRSKWIAVVLLVLFFWAYESFDLWNTPYWTASLILFYFLAASVVDGIFRGASFCKYVCPIGQFHFVSSLVSPLEVRYKNADVCSSCRTHDCLKGNETQPGCELHLFQPSKSGNMDCTFCLDCVKACPSDNIGLLAVSPGSDILLQRPRSSVGEYTRRPDLAALVLVFTFAAFVNAAGMVLPVLKWVEKGHGFLGFSTGGILDGSLFIFAVFLLPTALAVACGWIGAKLSRIAVPWLHISCGFSFALVPLGFSMWVAHFLYHFFTGFLTPWPVLQRFSKDWGVSDSSPLWNIPVPTFAWFPGFQVLLLNAGCLFTLWLLWKKSNAQSSSRPWMLFLPWATLALALYLFGIWIVLQPMEMRGTLLH
ncbi:MAG: cytochrome c oxidase assembly protein [Verrucomicrobia bacterium]|nr:cytochrome c oxidase assembly protein [Verrucomicrobiota bacterium]